MPDTPPLTPHHVAPPPQIIVQQPPTAFGRYGKFLLIALVLAVMALIGMSAKYQSYFSPPGEPQEKYHSLSKTASEKIAIIDISGTIMDTDGFVKKQLDRVSNDDDVVALVLRIDSPGGTVTASDYLYHHVIELAKERKLPVVVSMGGICASGGYYIAMAVGNEEDVIFAEPTTWTGSIGVVIPHYDLSGMLADFHVEDDSIASAQDKLMGSPTRELSDAERAKERKLFQDLVESSFARFKEIVLGGRPKFEQDKDAFKRATTGQIFTASQALELGLVDQIDFVEAAIERAAELAKRKPDDLRCIKYMQPASPLDALMSVKANPPETALGSLRAILDLSVPRAYYLCTWLPGLLDNAGR
ncbi:signal peptide peptidase SppA [Bythopirellula goksoeyrii]|uniref:Signal peptide peptidase SppA n=1 Tax=Bythopirellula goksoeyrii TaxID=1400387 RepID=A0A5B9QF37_9BACT|nr:signal peptide peptidase SppA [Bythopirellula goksoeyrii]QEG37628.1 Putative signal peptide peptidase SppA [Bythopirellula goksoeyrii]